MNHTRLWTAAAIITLVLVISFILSVPHTRDVAEAPLLAATSSTPVVSMRDTFKKGVHTITGSLDVPNACTGAVATASVVGDASSTERVLVEISSPKDEGVCLQLPTEANFSITIEAPAGLPITATVNGITANTTNL